MNSETQSEIIDIAPEDIVENDVGKTSAEKPATNSSLGRFTVKHAGLAALALMALSAIVGAYGYRNVLFNYFPSDQMQGMTTRLDALESTTKVLNGKLDAVVALTDEIKSHLGAAQTAAEEARKQAVSLQSEASDVKTRLAAAEKSISAANDKVTQLQSKLAPSASSATAIGNDNSGLTARIDSLEKDVASLKQTSGTAKPNTAELAQALASLKAKIAEGSAYADEIKAIKNMLPSAEGLDVLVANSAQGVSNAKTFAADLKAVAATLPKPEIVLANSTNTWWGRTTDLLSGLITIKTVGADDWPQIANQAASLADAQKLGDAIKIIEQAQNPLPAPLQKWLDRAAARLAVEQALEKTAAAVSREIAARG